MYLSGESYAGIYVPWLAYKMDTYINDPAHAADFKPKLKGIMVGNGCTNWKYDTTPAYLEMAYWHGLYDDATYQSMKDNDCFSQFS